MVETVVASGPNVTRRRLKAESPEIDDRLRALAQPGYDVMTVVDTDGVRRYVSPSIEGLLGYDPTELVNRSAHELVHPDDVPFLHAAIDMCRRGARQTGLIELRLLHRNGGWREFEMIGTSLLADPEVKGIVFHSRRVPAREAAERAWRGGEVRFREIFEASGVGTALTDGEGTILIANDAMANLLGYAPGDLTGVNESDVIHSDDTNRQEDYRRRAQAGEIDTYQLELRYLRKDGGLRWGMLHTTAVRDEFGALTALLAQVHDTTARKEAETALRESEKRFRSAFDHAPIGLAIVSRDGCFRQVNRSLCELVGYAEYELLGKTLQDITHPDDLGDDLEISTRLWAGEIDSYQLEKRYLHKDGRPVWVQLTGSAVHDDDGPRYVVAQIEDISTRRHLDLERATMLASEREYTRQLRDLTGMRADLSAMVAHELRSPIAALRMMTSMLATRELAPDQEAETLAAVQQQIDQLDRLVTDVVTAAAAERDEFSVEPYPVPLAVLVSGAAAFAGASLSQNPVSMMAPPEVRVWCDPERISQVLSNLLDNCAKHTPAGTPVELRTRVVGSRVLIEVADQGPGIAPADLALVFEKFGRGRETARLKTPGAGLGLYLSRRIVNAHDSELTVDSAPDRGTTFSFELKVV